ncbi:MAG: DUF4296 domain-containing protein [Flavobacteriales bacterium]
MKNICFILLLGFVFSCSQSSVPDTYLQPDELSKLVEEISVLEAYYQSTYGVPGQYKTALDEAVKLTLKKQQCSLSKFKKSVYYYAAHPELQRLLNESTMTRLSRKL